MVKFYTEITLILGIAPRILRGFKIMEINSTPKIKLILI